MAVPKEIAASSRRRRNLSRAGAAASLTQCTRCPPTYTVPAEGTIDYQYFQIDPGFTEDKCISMAEARPGNTAIVHHIVLFALPPGVKVNQPEEAQANGQMIAVYAPGMPPWRYPEGTALMVKAGSTFYIQMHYTACGREETDRSLVGLKFADPQTVKKKVMYGMAVNAGFEIPPLRRQPRDCFQGEIQQGHAALNLFPHMHFRGKSFRIEAVQPDGQREVLLDVPRYDFNWQLRYDLVEPKFMRRAHSWSAPGTSTTRKITRRTPIRRRLCASACKRSKRCWWATTRLSAPTKT